MTSRCFSAHILLNCSSNKLRNTLKTIWYPISKKILQSCPHRFWFYLSLIADAKKRKEVVAAQAEKKIQTSPFPFDEIMEVQSEGERISEEEKKDRLKLQGIETENTDVVDQVRKAKEAKLEKT